MTRVKICGITNEADGDHAVDAGADAIGVISGVPVDSPRAVSVSDASALVDRVPPFVTATLVTMPDTVDDAVMTIEQVAPDAVQLHDPGRLGGAEKISALADRVSASIGVIAVAEATDSEAVDYASVADALLVDASDPDGGGGTGRRTDWEAAADLRREIDVPLVLAGGLDPGTVREAIATVDPYGVDVATGVEASPGRKDPAAVEQFVAAAQDDPAESIEERREAPP